MIVSFVRFFFVLLQFVTTSPFPFASDFDYVEFTLTVPLTQKLNPIFIHSVMGEPIPPHKKTKNKTIRPVFSQNS